MTGILISLVAACFAADPPAPLACELIDVKKIWDQAPHNAFTDLVRFQNRWYCVFREGQNHVSSDGALRVLVSDDGETWTSTAHFTDPNADLRDAKITVTPDNLLMLSGAACLDPATRNHHQSLSWFSKDGQNWSEAIPVARPDDWLWRVTWHDGTAYGIGYGKNSTGKPNARLYSSTDGRDFKTLVDSLDVPGYPNESALVFNPDDSTATCLLRRDGEPASAYLGTAPPPYTDWTWQDLGTQAGGPNLLRLPDGRILAGVRLYDGKVRTSLCQLDPKTPALREILTLPSGGDTSYPGLVLHDGVVWVSYYSSHEQGKTSIYLARVRLIDP